MSEHEPITDDTLLDEIINELRPHVLFHHLFEEKPDPMVELAKRFVEGDGDSEG